MTDRGTEAGDGHWDDTTASDPEPDGDVEFRAPPGRPRPDQGIDPVGAVVGTLVAVSGALFFLQLRIDFLVVGPVGVRPVVLSATALALSMLVGGVLFLWAGRRTMALGHGGTGVGWALLLVGTWAGSGVALLLGTGVVGGTAAALVYEHRRS